MEQQDLLVGESHRADRIIMLCRLIYDKNLTCWVISFYGSCGCYIQFQSVVTAFHFPVDEAYVNFPDTWKGVLCDSLWNCGYFMSVCFSHWTGWCIRVSMLL